MSGPRFEWVQLYKNVNFQYSDNKKHCGTYGCTCMPIIFHTPLLGIDLKANFYTNWNVIF